MKTVLKIIILVTILLLILIGFFVYRNTNQRNNNIPTIRQTEEIKLEELPQLITIATGLEVPWAIAFLPDNSMLVTERPGRVRLVSSTGKVDPTPVLELSVVKKIQGEGGLHGIALHPDFEKNSYVYLYYTYENNGNQSLNKVVRYSYKNKKLLENKIIVDEIPGALFHDGGRIKFGPDKYLYITTGDAQDPSKAQDKNSLAGKILRVTDEGAVPADNPFGTLVYSYGHRNPQGITWDNTGQLWETEHGPSGSGANAGRDELNKIEKGKNYGWPEITGDQKKSGMESPVLQSGENTWAPGDIEFLNGALYFVGLRGQSLYKVKLDNPSSIETFLTGELGRLREIIVFENYLYVTTSNKDGRGIPSSGDDKIIRVNPSKL